MGLDEDLDLGSISSDFGLFSSDFGLFSTDFGLLSIDFRPRTDAGGAGVEADVATRSAFCI